MSAAEEMRLAGAPSCPPGPELAEDGASPGPIEDLRFRALLGSGAWAQLPAAVRRRFSKRIGPGEMIVYRGDVVATELSRAGRLLSFLARAIGGPLPLSDGATGPALVLVSEDAQLGGQCWLRIYTRPGRFPQAIHSAKRFRGPTGLEEYVGCGITMALRVSVEDAALVFRSAGYVVAVAGWRLPLPRFLSPGEMRIEHRDLGEGSFAFTLDLTHPLFGRLVYQAVHFRDA